MRSTIGCYMGTASVLVSASKEFLVMIGLLITFVKSLVHGGDAKRHSGTVSVPE